MKRISSLCLMVVLAFSSLVATPVFDLYQNLEVNYVRDNGRTDWLGFYRPGEDKIHLRPKGKYRHTRHLNHTALHELGHWTRHPSRLGTPKFASYMEEIMCDLVAAILADEMKVARESNKEISAYVHMQMGGHRIQPQIFALLLDEVQKSVEFVLQDSYDREKIKEYFRAVEIMSERELASLS